MRNRLERKEEFIKHLAEFLGGSNAARMSIGLEMGGQLGEVAKIWVKIASASPVRGYASVEEAHKALREFLL